MNLSEIKQNIDHVAVIEATGVELKRQGNRHVGRCPFHADNSPSFTVFDDGYFKCFGCGEYGDVVDFIEKLHGCDFKHALSILGIIPEGFTPQKQRRFNKLQYQCKLIRAFRQWEIEAADEVSMLCRCTRKVLAEIKTEADLDKHGDLYHGLATWEHHLDILINGDNQEKLALFRSSIYG